MSVMIEPIYAAILSFAIFAFSRIYVHNGRLDLDEVLFPFFFSHLFLSHPYSRPGLILCDLDMWIISFQDLLMLLPSQRAFMHTLLHNGFSSVYSFASKKQVTTDGKDALQASRLAYVNDQ